MTARSRFTQTKKSYLKALVIFTATKQAIADQDIQFCKDNGFHYPMWQIDDEATFNEAASGFQKVLDESGLQDLSNKAYDNLVSSKRAFIEASIGLMPKCYQNEKETLLKHSTSDSVIAHKLLDIALSLNTKTIPA
jgi:hypothetical protein